ncbi:MAG: histidinol dehydrogenase [Thermoanaerobaculia bacterium]|nr:histidinol dehydrogenase [Thermoanaerobaculia bacterium]
MALFSIVDARRRSGQKLLNRLESRSDGILDPKVVAQTAKIVDSIRRGGDRSLLKAVRKFDGVKRSQVVDLRLRPERADRRTLPAGFEHALERAIVAVERYHEAQRHPSIRLEEAGIRLEEQRRPLRRVGVYVPGGRATYPSSVVMTVGPAKLAGVEEIVVATPLAGWERSASLRHALERLGVTEVWAMGGAHGVAALAYGTETIRRVDKIVGPGNAWVTAAKHVVSTRVGIEGLTGPSEVVIVATGSADPSLVAADLLAQAEHDPQATTLLITDQAALARRVRSQIKTQIRSLETAPVIRQSLHLHGGAVVVPNLETALEWVERIAPEHLQLVGEEAETLADRVRNAGAVFVGEATPVAFGDYLAGPSHCLPTGGSARYASALGVEDFVRRSHLVQFSATAAERCARATAILADVEGLPAHAEAARRRSDLAREDGTR